MKFLDYTPISLTALFPPKAGTLKHLQDISAEGFNATIQALIGSAYDPTEMYILFGCKNTGSGSNYIVSAGAVFFNGQYYLVPAATFTISGSNVAVGTITQSNFVDVTADPVKFTDNVLRNVHQIFTVVFAAGLSGSGTANFSAALSIASNIKQLVLTGTGAATVTGTYPNLAVNVPNSTGVVVPILEGNYPIGTLTSGGAKYTVSLGTTLLSAVYDVKFTPRTSSPTVNPGGISVTIANTTTTSFDMWVYPAATVPSNISIDWTLFQ